MDSLSLRSPGSPWLMIHPLGYGPVPIQGPENLLFLPPARRDWGQEEKGMTEDEMAGWHHRLDGHEFEWTPGVGDGEGGLACCSSWGCKESDMTDRLNWTELWHLGQIRKYLIFKRTMVMKIDFTAPSRNLLAISNNHYYQENFLCDLNPVQQNLNVYLLHSQRRQILACLNSFSSFFKKSFWKPQFSFLSSQRNNPYSFNFSRQTFNLFGSTT